MKISKPLVYGAMFVLLIGFGGVAKLALAQDAAASTDFDVVVQQGEQQTANDSDAQAAQSDVDQGAQSDGQDGLTEVVVTTNEEVPAEVTQTDTQNVEGTADVQETTSDDSSAADQTSGDQTMDPSGDQSSQDQGIPDQGSGSSDGTPTDSGSFDGAGQ